MKEIMGIKREAFHYWVYFGALCLLVISLPTSRFFISVALQTLIYNWLLEGRLREKWQRFTRNRAAVAFTLIYLSYVFSLLWSVDVKYAIQNDLFHKSPTLFMPLILASSPRLDAHKLRLLLFLFIASVLSVSLIGFTLRLVQPSASFREASPFMPGIYLGLMLVISAFQLPPLIRQVSSNKKHFWISIAVSAWFIFFLFYLRALSGIASFIAASFYLVFLFVRRLKSLPLKLIVAFGFLLLLFLILKPLVSIHRQTNLETAYDFSSLEKYSEAGYPYVHDTTKVLRENGNLVYLNIAEKELRDAWNKRSEVGFYDNDLKGWKINYTLYRYMASQGLKKDSAGLSQLDDCDIRAVERGTTDYLNVSRPGFYIRIYEEFMGLYIYRASDYRNPTWGSFSKRVDLWRASLLAFTKKPLFGWGIGGILHATDYGFQSYSSPLADCNMKPHNQYMYFLLTQGLVGLFLFLFLFTYMIVKSGAWKNQAFRVFIILMAVFWLANNPLESQVGQNIFVFFTLFYCFFYRKLVSGGPNGSTW